MNIYDFDGTLYAGDSTMDFLKFSLKKHPAKWDWGRWGTMY